MTDKPHATPESEISPGIADRASLVERLVARGVATDKASSLAVAVERARAERDSPLTSDELASLVGVALYFRTWKSAV